MLVVCVFYWYEVILWEGCIFLWEYVLVVVMCEWCWVVVGKLWVLIVICEL